MKKLLAFLCSVIIVAAVLTAIAAGSRKYIDKNYFEDVGGIVSEPKYKSMVLQAKALERDDDLLIYGSSELGEIDNPFNPSIFFRDNKDGFQVFIIGQSGYRPLIHAINFGAMGEKLKGHKVVFILSPSWFLKDGTIDVNTFHSSYSEEMFYAYMFSNTLDRSLKKELARRVLNIIDSQDKKSAEKALSETVNAAYNKKMEAVRQLRLKRAVTRPEHVSDASAEHSSNEDLKRMGIYCGLYLKNDLFSKFQLAVISPYYKLIYFLLKLRDDMKSVQLLLTHKNIIKEVNPGRVIDWERQKETAVEYARRVANNNPFGFDNKLYDLNTRDYVKEFEGVFENFKNDSSAEYGDFKLLLDVCKNQGIKPLIINPPLNGKWADFCKMNKLDIQNYNNKAGEMVKAYGFEYADFSNHAYDEYFLRDAMHLGSKGWVYVNEAIDRYYHEKVR